MSLADHVGAPPLGLDAPLAELMARSAALRDQGHGDVVSYSRKVFIPLTRFCRDVCHYCTFARVDPLVTPAYMTPAQVLAVAEAGAKRGCKEALFTLGDKPELRYRTARDALRGLGYQTTVDYLRAMAELVRESTGLLPHINCGVLSRDELALLRPVAPSMGLMLESAATRLCQPGGPHFGSPDKDPQRRLACIRAAGELAIPLTSGILIGIGETRVERLHSLRELAAMHQRYGHLQEIIVQNFAPKHGTQMQATTPPPLDELLWTVSVARLVFGPAMSIQVPPNLNAGHLGDLIAAGINDWGGVSPVTPDYVNPASPWPQLEALSAATTAARKVLVERLTIYPAYIRRRKRWLDPALFRPVLRLADSDGYARDGDWAAGGQQAPPLRVMSGRRTGGTELTRTLDHAADGKTLTVEDLVSLFRARGDAVETVCHAADALRREQAGDTVTYVVNCNINYTNVCLYRCGFCAFSKRKTHERWRGDAYLVSLEEIARRTREARSLGATEVCMQGGIHPEFTGRTYMDICRTAADAAPGIHVHAFSPLEVTHGASSLGISTREFLQELKQAGLGSLPGTAAEILDDSVRAQLCPDKISTQQWLTVVEEAHVVGLRTSATIMFGHLEDVRSWAKHLLALRRLQQRTGGITEFVPLPFVHMEAPLYRRGLARPGPTFREALLMHAVARLALHPHIPNVQVSWPKLGTSGALQCLQAGANDFGGTLMSESISRAAGALHGQKLSGQHIESLIRSIDRTPRQRSTLYDLESCA
jgi:FO synthase